MNDEAFVAQCNCIRSNLTEAPELLTAIEHAEEYGLSYPDAFVGGLLSLLSLPAVSAKSGVVVAGSALGVMGYYVARGMGMHTRITFIEPEIEHQKNAQAVLKALGVPAKATRFLPSFPLDVIGRLATGAYGLVICACPPAQLPRLVETSWRLVAEGGYLAIIDSLLDGTISDPSRRDRATIAAREANDIVGELEHGVAIRLPLGAGITVIARQQETK